jgi:hypothetical protein
MRFPVTERTEARCMIEEDIDGSGSLPMRIDDEVPNLGKFAACRQARRAPQPNSGLAR